MRRLRRQKDAPYGRQKKWGGTRGKAAPPRKTHSSFFKGFAYIDLEEKKKESHCYAVLEAVFCNCR